MREVLFFCLVLFAGQEPAPSAPVDLAAGVARILGHAGAGPAATGVVELLALGDVAPILLESLGTGRTPPTEDGEGTLLGPDARVLLHAAVAGLGPARLSEFVVAVEREPSRATSVAAALRVLALLPESGAGAMLALARTAEANGCGEGVEEALEDALAAAFARNARDCADVAGAWVHLGALAASGAVGALERTADPQALVTLRTLLGRRNELDACVLNALANQAARVAPADAGALAAEIEPYVEAEDSASAQAAAAALGRLGLPGSVPALVEALENDDPVVARAVLAALRALGGVALPASAPAWRAWFAREEAWRIQRLPVLLAAMDEACGEASTEASGEAGAQGDAQGEVQADLKDEAGEADLAALVMLVRELSEHPLFRDELVAAFVPLLGHAQPEVRILACQALQRLGSRLALRELVVGLEDRERAVVTAAHAALVGIAGVELPPKRGPWLRYLSSQAPPAALGNVAAARPQ